jgi:predicted acylesterase/phospholipase RssA
MNIVLQGGGTRCAYQVSFLDTFMKANTKHKINNIYGTSFGALVGYFFCIRRLDILYNFFISLNEDSLKKHFDFFGYGKYLTKIPILGYFFSVIINIVWLLKSIKHKSLYDQDSSVNDLFNFTLTDLQKKDLYNFYCCVYNITKQRTEYINGSHPLIVEYIIASSSLWILFKPRLIRQLKSECICDENCGCSYKCKSDNENFCDCDNETHKFNEYMDGGLLKSIPFAFDPEYHGEYLVLTTKNIHNIKNKKFIFNNSGSHLFEYLDNIITHLVEYIQHIEIEFINKDWHTQPNVHLINYDPVFVNPDILNKEIIMNYIKDGEILAHEFFEGKV